MRSISCASALKYSFPQSFLDGISQLRRLDSSKGVFVTSVHRQAANGQSQSVQGTI